MNNEDIKVLEEYIKEQKEFAKQFNLEEIEDGTEGQRRIQAIENLIKGYKELDKENTRQHELLGKIHEKYQKDYIPKSKVREVLYTKYIAMFEGDTEFPDDATIMKTVKYVKVSDIEQLLQEGNKDETKM